MSYRQEHVCLSCRWQCGKPGAQLSEISSLAPCPANRQASEAISFVEPEDKMTAHRKTAAHCPCYRLSCAAQSAKPRMGTLCNQHCISLRHAERDNGQNPGCHDTGTAFAVWALTHPRFATCLGICEARVLGCLLPALRSALVSRMLAAGLHFRTCCAASR